MKDEYVKILVLSVGTFAIGVCANIVAESFYARTKIGVDKNTAVIASLIGVGVAFGLMKYYKKA